MESNLLTALFMPLALAVIMLGLGLSLTLDDFRRILVYPRAVIVGLACQVLLLPVVCFAIATAFGLGPELAVGLMLLAASPGGATANLFSHLARGDLALNITLTAANSVLSVVTLPLIVGLSMAHFMGQGGAIPLQFGKVVQVVAIVLGPVAIGMVVRAKRPGLSARLDKPVRAISAAFLGIMIIATAIGERDGIVDAFLRVGPAALAFNLVSLVAGYVLPRLVRLPKRQAVAIGMEIGVHNATMAIAIASSPMLLGNATMAIPPAIYGLIMFVTATVFGLAINRRADRAGALAAEAAPAR
jgi:BASS family bile acid:Na+ symporter